MRDQRIRPGGKVEDDIDEAFWAKAAAEKAAGPSGDQSKHLHLHPLPTTPLTLHAPPPPALDGDPAPFATQFFNDDFDDGPGFDYDDGPDGGAPVEAGEEDLLAAMRAQTRRVRPETVNYAKRAKRVDVRKLKDNIWRGLDIVAPAVEEGEDAMVRPPPLSCDV